MIVKIEKLVYGALGLARNNGKIILVENVLPGEEIDIRPIKEKKDYTLALAREIITKNPFRTNPFCEYYGKCGGCDLQIVNYEEEIRLKKDMLKDTLRKVLPPNDKEIELVPSKREINYRHRVSFHVKEGVLGFMEKNSNNIVNIDKCPLLIKEINDIIPFLKSFIKNFNVNKISIFFSKTENNFLMKVETDSYIEKEKLKKFKENYAPKELVSISLFKKDKFIFSLGPTFTFIDILNKRFRVSSGSFFQSNFYSLENFISKIKDNKKRDFIVDLYGGVGLISMFFDSKRIELSDTNKWAVNDASYNAKINQKKGFESFVVSSLSHLKRLLKEEPSDLIIVDPPRAGLSKEEIEYLLKLKVNEIFYISCYPPTLERDLKELKKEYEIESVSIVDMFPRTHHIEAVCKLKIRI